ncbi:hypothetical protein [Natronorarus salvus]|uniref:hypothetical protein n=1 Tax=Natronorarus salvus TaxID=3117733 RepID=UPI002F266CA6
MALFSTFKRGVMNPRLVAWKINELSSRYLLHYLRPPTAVFEEDWDNLIILDACHKDLLTENTLDFGDYKKVWSGGSDSESFLSYNVGDRQLDDVVYITANPWVSEYEDQIFRVLHAWETDWDEDSKTVLPSSMAKIAEKAESEYPNKRIVVHFMQPHYPFLGPTADKLPNHRTFTGGGKVTTDSADSIWDLLQEGEADPTMVWQAYKETLDIVLPVALDTAQKLNGKSVLTSDHGNAFGERSFPIPIRTYGHQKGNHIPAMSQVPWIEFEADNRRVIKSDYIASSDSSDDDLVQDRLKHLGYK